MILGKYQVINSIHQCIQESTVVQWGDYIDLTVILFWVKYPREF